MTRILHPTDFSPASRAAFITAVKLAKKDRAELVIMHVLARARPSVDHYVGPEIFSQIEAGRRQYGRKHLDALVAKARKAGVRARALLLDGLVHDRIVRAARAQGADMIVMGTHGRTGLAKLVLGSVASRVVTLAACPVLTVRGGRRGARAGDQPKALRAKPTTIPVRAA